MTEAKKRTTKWQGGALADMIEKKGEFAMKSPEITGNKHIKRLIQSVRKAVNVVMVGQSVLLHTGTIAVLGPTSQCSANCRNSGITATAGAENGKPSNKPPPPTAIDNKNIKAKLDELKKQYPDVAQMPVVKQKALLDLYERDKAEIERRKKEQTDVTNPQENTRFKTQLQVALQNPKAISYNNFFRDHESIVLQVDDQKIQSGDNFLNDFAVNIKERTPTLKTLQSVAKITATPADEDKTVEQDMINVSVYEYLNSIKDPATPKVVGSCQAKAKAAIMLMEKLFPQYKDKIFYIKEWGHTYAAIEINGRLFAINNGQAYIITDKQRYGTAIYSPLRSIMNFTGTDTPAPADCNLKPKNRCLLSQKQSLAGEKINVTIPPDLKEGKKAPSPTEDDGIGESDEKEKLLSRTESLSQLYPDMEKAVREQIYKDVRAKAEKVYPNLTDTQLHKLVEEETPFFYSEAQKRFHLNVGKIFADVEKTSPPEKTAQGIIDLMEAEQSGKLIMDFKDADKYNAETLQKIFDTKPQIERSYIFDGITYDLLRAIGSSKINGKFSFVFKDEETFKKSKQLIYALLELQNAPQFDITFVLAENIKPDEEIIGKIVELLETHPVKVKIYAEEQLHTPEKIYNRIDQLNQKSEHLYDLSPADDKTYEVGRVLAPRLEITDDDWIAQSLLEIGRMKEPGIAYLTARKFKQLSLNRDDLTIHYSEAERETFKEFPGNIRGLTIDAGMNVSDAITLINNYKGIVLEVTCNDKITPELATVLSAYKGKILKINGLKQLDSESAKALGNFKGFSLELEDLPTLNLDTARELANFKGNNLYLGGILTMDAEPAGAIANFRGERLTLGIITLDENTATALSNYKGTGLTFPHLTSLDENTARALTKYTGNYLTLSRMTSHSISILKALVTSKVNGLSIGIKSEDLTPEKAQILAAFPGKELGLRRIFTLTPDVAEQLVKFKGKALYLGLETLNPEVARILATFEGDEIILSGITSLSTACAIELAKFKGKELGFWNLETVTPEGLEALASFAGNIPGTIFTEGKAKELVKKADNKELYLNDYDFINKTAASIIATYTGEKLWLENLSVLTPEVARELAQFKGEVIGLYGLKSLTPETAKELANFNFKGTIGLDGLADLNADTARELAKFEGITISLNGLNSLDTPIAEIIATFGCKTIRLEGIKKLDVSSAKALSGFKGEWIYLDGLNNLEPEVELELAKFPGHIYGILISAKDAKHNVEFAEKNNTKTREMDLNHHKMISTTAAVEIAKYSGEKIWLDGLKTLTPEVATELAKFEGKLISLNGLTKLEPDTARELVKSKAKIIRLNNLTELTPELANILTFFQGDTIGLGGISTISLASLQELTKVKFKNIFLGLTNSSMTLEIAEELAKFKGEYISLHNITHLEPQIAGTLAKFGGKRIDLTGLTELGPASAKNLATFKGDYINIKNIKHFSPVAMQQFGIFKGRTFLPAELVSEFNKNIKRH